MKPFENLKQKKLFLFDIDVTLAVEIPFTRAAGSSCPTLTASVVSLILSQTIPPEAVRIMSENSVKPLAWRQRKISLSLPAS